MADFADQITYFKNQVISLFQNPSYVKAELNNNHPLLVEVIGILLVVCLLVLALFKPSTSPTLKSPALPEKPPAADIPTPKTKPPKKQNPPAEPQAWIKREPPSIHELSQEEEQALNQAMAIAGKQALAEATGAPHQAEFFQNNDPSEAAKKMFARQKKEEQQDGFPPPVEKREFILLYFMAPRSHIFENSMLFPLLEQAGLTLNEQHVFEYREGAQILFYVSSALKPGTFDLHSLHASTPGLSFVLDLPNLQEGKIAFNKMLALIHTLSLELKGDVLDEYRQRLTQTTINSYLARIKAFQQIQQGNA